MLERLSRIALIVIALCLSFNVLRDLSGILVAPAGAQLASSANVVRACKPGFQPGGPLCNETNYIWAVPVVQVTGLSW